MDSESVGIRIKRAREQLGLSQERLGEMVELPQSTISYLEAGSRRLSVSEVPRFADVLQQPMTYFLEGELSNSDWDQAVLKEFHRIDSPEAREAFFKVIRVFQEFADSIKAKNSRSD
ncbi:MAG: helix-turn-helix transcriptional regulator [Anaerolineae bacterium]|nr:helix-turn-helix transcriptional regulator [Anaerolineae bacterium]